MVIDIMYSLFSYISASYHKYPNSFLRELFAEDHGRNPTLNRPALESVLKKCPNISEVIICNISTPLLTLFGQHCPRMKSLHMRLLEAYLCYFEFRAKIWPSIGRITILGPSSQSEYFQTLS